MSKKNRLILIIDDEKAILQTISEIFSDEGMKSLQASSGEEGISLFEKHPEIDLVLLDVWMKGIDGLETLRRIKKLRKDCPVIMMSGHAGFEDAVQATKEGAYDFLEKPLSYDKLLITISRSLRESDLLRENRTLKKQQGKTNREIIGKSEQIRKIQKQIEVSAPSEGRVLISGENGTGKELVARQIHQNSKRKEGPFVEVNCAAIPEELIESILFGHEKGSFTGAFEQRSGKFDQADGGTLFLDEIGDMSLNTQAKILRVLEEMTFERVGSNKTIRVDVRIIAASNKNLEEEIQENRFREDLLYRLNVIPFHLPPLRERKEDVPILAENFIRSFSEENHYREKKISPEAMKILCEYHWPGNIRELKNIIERMLILVSGEVIEKKDIPPAILPENQKISGGNRFGAFPDDYKEAKEIFEKNFLRDKLEKYRGNVSKTAKEIGLDRSHLNKKLKYHQLEFKPEKSND